MRYASDQQPLSRRDRTNGGDKQNPGKQEEA
jgi:hypothetical protein